MLAGVAGLLIAGGLRSTLDAQQPTTGRSAAAITPAAIAPHLAILDQTCLECHDNVGREAGLSLEDIAKDDVAKHADVWEKVIRKLRTRHP